MFSDERQPSRPRVLAVLLLKKAPLLSLSARSQVALGDLAKAEPRPGVQVGDRTPQRQVCPGDPVGETPASALEVVGVSALVEDTDCSTVAGVDVDALDCAPANPSPVAAAAEMCEALEFGFAVFEICSLPVLISDSCRVLESEMSEDCSQTESPLSPPPLLSYAKPRVDELRFSCSPSCEDSNQIVRSERHRDFVGVLRRTNPLRSSCHKPSLPSAEVAVSEEYPPRPIRVGGSVRKF